MKSDVLTAITRLENLHFLTPATESQVQKAEEELGLKFADEYREYVLKYGVISAKNIELTGITTAKRLDVVAVTKQERLLNSIPQDMYVLENIAIEGIIILQDCSGNVFSITQNEPLKCICKSLSDYIALSIDK